MIVLWLANYLVAMERLPLYYVSILLLLLLRPPIRKSMGRLTGTGAGAEIDNYARRTRSIDFRLPIWGHRRSQVLRCHCGLFIEESTMPFVYGLFIVSTAPKHFRVCLCFSQLVLSQ